jgi:glyoxylase-like metal-dependent hydrolase (beta-lactamase superfamily II)
MTERLGCVRQTLAGATGICRIRRVSGRWAVRRAAAVQIASQVWRIPTTIGDLINTFALVDDDGTVTLIDAGLARANRRIRAGLSTLGAQPAAVRRIIVTHAHRDHAGGLRRLVNDTGADVASHEREAPYLRDGRSSRFGGGRRQSFHKVTVAEQFLDGSLLPVAGGLRVIHTPGHTPGHVCLLHERTGVLITGDALYNMRHIRYSPDWLCTDADLNRKSADALGDLDYDVVAFAHGPEISTGAREAVRAFLLGKER